MWAPRAMLVLGASFVSQLINDGFMFGGDVLPPYLVDYFHISNGQVLLLTSLMHAPTLLLGPVSSWATNRWGGRAVVMTFGAASALSFYASAFVGAFWELLAINTATGVFLGLYSVPRVTCVSFHFPKRLRSFATSFGTIGGSIGAAIFPFVYQLLLSSMSWRLAFVYLAAVLAQNVVCGALMGPTPALPDDQEEEDEARRRHAKPEDAPKPHPWAFWAYLLTCSVWSLAEWADCMFALWLDSEGYGRFEIAALLTVFTTASILGRVLASLVALSFSRHILLINTAMILTMASSNLIASLVYSFPGFVFAKGLMGLSFGLILGMEPALVLQLVELKDFNKSMGLSHFVFGCAGIVSPPLAGYIVDQTGSFRGVWRGISGMVAVSVVPMLAFHWPLRGLCGGLLAQSADSDVPGAQSAMPLVSPDQEDQGLSDRVALRLAEQFGASPTHQPLAKHDLPSQESESLEEQLPETRIA